MASDKTYYSIEKSVATEIKIKRSVFICSLEKAQTIESAKQFISETSKNNKTATHNCWAYIIGDKAQTYHCSDAGEPSGTAGKPMLNALFHHDLTDVAAVVTRHYGGVKLGVRGLMDAYFQSVESAVKKAVLVRKVLRIPYKIELGYEFNDTFLNQIRAMGAKVAATQYSEKIVHDIVVEADHQEKMVRLVREYGQRGWIRLLDGQE